MDCVINKNFLSISDTKERVRKRIIVAVKGGFTTTLLFPV